MKRVKIVVWQEGEWWLGYVQDYPDFWTQGESLDDLKLHLRDLYDEMMTGNVKCRCCVEEIEID